MASARWRTRLTRSASFSVCAGAHRLMSGSQRESSLSAESAVLWASGPLSQTSASVSSVCRSSGGCPHLCKRSYNSPLTINSRASRSSDRFSGLAVGETERPSSQGRWWLMPCRNCRLSASRRVSAATGLPASVSAIRCRAVASVCASVLLNRPAMRTGSTER